MKTPKTTVQLILGIIMAVLFNTFVGVIIAAFFGANPIGFMIGMNVIGLSLNMVRNQMGENALGAYPGILTEGLATEIYLAELLRKFRPDAAFLARARDFSAYVNSDKINYAEAGADPGIVVDYDHTDPLDVADDEDTPKEISLKSFSTERSRVTETQQDARAYQILADRMQRHADTQNESILKYSATAFAPASNGTYTPIIRTTGAADASGSFKMLKLADVIELDVAMRNLDVTGPRILVLNPTHLGHLMKEDKDLFKGFVPNNPNASFPLYGFECFVSTATPRYITDGAPTRKAWNATQEAGDLIASFAFVGSEVARARGSVKVYKTLEDAAYQASFISTRVRFTAAQLRGKYVGALVAKAV